MSIRIGDGGLMSRGGMGCCLWVVIGLVGFHEVGGSVVVVVDVEGEGVLCRYFAVQA